MNCYLRRLRIGLILSLAGLLWGCSASPLPAVGEGDGTASGGEGNGTPATGETGGNGSGAQPVPDGVDPFEGLTLAERFAPLESLDDAVLIVSVPFDIPSDIGAEGGDPGVEDPNNVDGSEPPPGADFYTVTHVGALGSNSFHLIGLNNIPTVVGSPSGTAAQWTNGLLETLPMGYEANAINDAGIIAGRGAVGFGESAVMWEGGTRTVLAGLNDQNSAALDINAIGQIVGWNVDPLETRSWAFIWESGNATKLAELPNSATTRATAVNNWGQVVGWADLWDSRAVAVLWDEGIAIDLVTPNGIIHGKATGISDHGEVVGWASNTASQFGFMWQDGVMSNLGSLGFSAGAMDINNVGQAVGEAYVGFGMPHAVLWENGETVDLNDRIADSDWLLTTAMAINDAGHIIGYGSLNGGPSTVFLLTPIKQPGQKIRSESGVLDPNLLRTITGPVVACKKCDDTRKQLCVNIKAYLRQITKAFELIRNDKDPVTKIGLRDSLVKRLKGGDGVANLIPVGHCRDEGVENVLGECLTVVLDENLRGIWPDKRIAEYLVEHSLPLVKDSDGVEENGLSPANAGSVSVQLQFALMIKGLIYNSAARLALHVPPESLPDNCNDFEPITAEFVVPTGELITADSQELVKLADLWLDFANRWGGVLKDDIPDLIGDSPDSLCEVMKIYELGPCP